MEKISRDPASKKPAATEYGMAEGNTPLFKFFTERLKDIYWAEKQLIDMLPGMEAAATTDQLKSAIGHHHIETVGQLERLEKVFQVIGQKAEGKVCFAIQGLIKEASAIMAETDEGSMIRDAAIIMAAQKVEHYEIASYASLTGYAKALGLEDAMGLLQLTLDEERLADNALMLIAQNKINWEAELEPVQEAGSGIRRITSAQTDNREK